MDGFRAQHSNHTAENRYPNVFKSVRHLLRGRDATGVRILSFGCSSGEEVATLSSLYFPGAAIVGVDVDEAVLAIARERHSVPGLTTYDISSPETIARHGPYDVIFAMGVLCRWPDTQDAAHIGDLFPFAQYDHLVTCLHRSLKTGGYLVINGSNYQFLDTAVAELYGTVLVKAVANNGMVQRFAHSAAAAGDHRGTDTIYRKLGDEAPAAPGPTFRNIAVLDADGDHVGVLTLSRR